MVKAFGRTRSTPNCSKAVPFFITKENDELEALVLVLGETVKPLYTLVI